MDTQRTIQQLETQLNELKKAKDVQIQKKSKIEMLFNERTKNINEMYKNERTSFDQFLENFDNIIIECYEVYCKYYTRVSYDFYLNDKIPWITHNNKLVNSKKEILDKFNSSIAVNEIKKYVDIKLDDSLIKFSSKQ